MTVKSMGRRAFLEAVIDRNRTENPDDEGLEHGVRFAENVVKGAGTALAGIPEGVGVLAKGAGEQLTELAERSRMLAFLDPVGKMTKEAGELARSAAEATRQLTDLDILPGKGNFLTEDVAQGVGSTLPLIATGGAAAAAGAGKVAMTALVATQGALMNGAAEFMDAELSGSPEDEKWTSFLLGAAVGTSEALPIGNMARRLGGIDKRSGGMLKRLMEVALEGGEEAIQEVFQTASSNLIADHVRGEDRKVFEGALKAGTAGGAVGLLLSMLIPGKQAGPRPEGPIELEAEPYDPEAPEFPNDPSQRLGQGGEVGFLRREFGGEQDPVELDGQRQLESGQRVIENPDLPTLAESQVEPAEPERLPAALQPMARLLKEAEAQEAAKPQEKPADAAPVETTKAKRPSAAKLEDVAARDQVLSRTLGYSANIVAKHRGSMEKAADIERYVEFTKRDMIPFPEKELPSESRNVARVYGADNAVLGEVFRRPDGLHEVLDIRNNRVVGALPGLYTAGHFQGGGRHWKFAPQQKVAGHPEPAMLPQEEGLFGEQTKEGAPRKEGADLTGQQALLIDDQKGDQRGQQTITDLTDSLKEQEAKSEPDAQADRIRLAKLKKRKPNDPIDDQGFVAGLSRLGGSRAKQVLNKVQGVNGQYARRGNHIRDLVDDGYRIVTVKGERRLKSPRGSFFTQADLTKTGLDFAEYLIGLESKAKRSEASQASIQAAKAGDGTLQEFIRGMGGVEHVPDLENLMEREIGKKRRPGFGRLVHPKGSDRGISLDTAIEAATERGFFPGREVGDVTPAEFFEALENDIPSEAQLEREAIRQETQTPASSWHPFDVAIEGTTLEQADADEDGTVEFYSGIAPITIPGWAKRFIKRNFASKGNLPDPAFEAKLDKDHHIQAELERSKLLVKDFDAQVRKDFGKKVSKEQMAELDLVFKGEASPDSLSPELQAVIEEMRQHVDRLSRWMVNNGVVDGPLAARITENLGFYATRTYKVFEDPDWAKKVPIEVRNRYKALLLEGYILPERVKEIHRRASDVAARAQKRLERVHKGRKRIIKAEGEAELGQLLRDTKRARQIVERLTSISDMDQSIAAINREVAAFTSLSKHAESNLRRITERMIRQGAKADTDLALGIQKTWMRAAEKAQERVELESRPEVDTDEEAERLIDRILYNGKAADNPIAFLAQGSLDGSKDLSILKRRKGLPVELRELLGENKSPRTNYANSVIKMATLVQNHRFLQTLKAEGMGVFLWEDVATARNRVEGIEAKIEKLEEKDELTEAQEAKLEELREQLEPALVTLEQAKSAPEGSVVQVSAKGAPTLEPIAGLWTFPEVKEALQDFVGDHPIDQAWLRAWLKASGVTKASKTVLSEVTHVRNLVANTGFMVANGNWRVWKAPRAMAGMAGGILAKKTVFGNTPKEWRTYWLSAVKYGVVQESTSAGEIRAIARDAAISGSDFLTDITERNVAKSVFKVTARLYQAEDDFPKLYAWENEKAKYRKARPDLSSAEIDKLTARIVADTIPTYSRVPRAIRGLRRFPALGNFPSFTSEVIRVGGNTLRLAHSEMQDPRTRGIGASRLVGAMMAASLPATLAWALRYIQGISDEEDEDSRVFVPPWSQNSTIMHMGQDEKGRRRYIDFSYTDPYSYLKKPIRALMRGENWQESLMGAAVETLEPFLGPEILTSAVIDIARNKTASGRKVYNLSAPWEKTAFDVAAHLEEAFEPGLISSARRIAKGLSGDVEIYGKAYDAKIEAITMMTGLRLSVIDLRQGLGFIASNYQRTQSEATSLISDVTRRSGTVSDEDIIDAYETAEAIRREAFERLRQGASAAQALGFTREQTEEAIAASSTEKAAQRVMKGRYEKYEPSSSFMRTTINRAPRELHKELERRREAVLRAAKNHKDKDQ